MLISSACVCARQGTGMKKMFFIIVCAALTAAASFACGCAREGTGWSIDEDAAGIGSMSEDPHTDGPDGDREAGTAEGVPEAESGSDEAGSPDAGDGRITVHVCGAVVSPGVYVLPAGSRVADAVEAAGGMTPEAAADHENLAMPVTDAQKIVILTAEEAGTDPYGLSEICFGDSEIAGLININTATAAELETLPGIGSVKAEAIIAWRRRHGGFASIEDIRNVSGIGDATWEDIRDLITV